MSRFAKPTSWLPLFLLAAVSLVVVVRTEPTPPANGPGGGAAGTFGKRRAVVFGIDGCRSDALKLAVENGTAPNIKSLIDSGAVTWNAFAGGKSGTVTQQTTNSGPGWSSVLTGVWRDKHGVNDNSFAGRNFTGYPHFFRHLHDSHPTSNLSSLVSWPEINNYVVEDSGGSTICTCHTYSSGSYDSRDIDLIAQTIDLIETGNPDVIFCYQGNVDIMGHTYGFHPTVSQYMTAIAASDQRIGQVLDAIRARPDYAEEDWLYIVTTDHGGLGTGHGGQSQEERTIPFVASGGNVPRGLISREVIGQVAVPATVYRHLGLGIPASWGWESDAFQIGAQLKASTGARSIFLSWRLPPAGIAGLTGFELRRNGVTIATPSLTDRNFTDSPAGTPGTPVSYTLSFTGSTEAVLTASTVTPGITPVSSAPEVHLKFDGDLSDASGRANDATAEGTPTYITGKSGQALSLDGTNSARIGTVSTGAPADLRFGTDTDFTVSFWFKANTPWTGDPSILSNKNWSSGANQGWIIAGENNGNDWQWNLKGSQLTRKDFDPSTANIAGSEWHLVTISHDRDGDAIFYHDGAEIGRNSIAGAGNIDTTLPVRIGRDGNNAFAWNQGAFIDDLKIWRRVLSPAEVTTELHGSNPTGAFNTWMADQAALYVYTGSATSPTDDPDGDGSNNLQEYAANTSPFRSSDTPWLDAVKIPGGLRLYFLQRDGGTGIHGTDTAYLAGGLRYSVERSHSLGSDWLPVQGSALQADAFSTPASIGTHEIAIDVTSPDDREFCRLKVEFDTP